MQKVATIILAFLLTGCIGATVSDVENNIYQYTEMDRSHIKGNPPIEDGAIRVGEVTKWCGATLWAVIIPIPLMLPVCKEYREIVYSGGELVSRTEQKVTYPMYACGPGMLIAGISHGYKGNIFCGKW